MLDNLVFELGIQTAIDYYLAWFEGIELTKELGLSWCLGDFDFPSGDINGRQVEGLTFLSQGY